MEESSSRMSLGEFLRSRRERLTLEDVGLVSYGRRRTPGLRREEVAQLAHIGTSWYSSLEQGRSVNPSEEVLNNIAQALRLTEDERHHLHLLARPVQQNRVEEQQLNIGLERMIMALEPNPAFVIGRCWDLILWNKAAELVFRFPPFSGQMQEKPNWMRLLMSDEKRRSVINDWESRLPVIIARFRADYAHYPNDTRFKELIEEFMQTSPLFREKWPLHDVQVVSECHKEWNEPGIGELEFEHLTLQPPDHPDLKIMIYTASPATAELLRSVMSTTESDVYA